MADTVSDFYDQLAPTYHLIFTDWAHAVQQHGVLLSALIRAHLGDGPRAFLDCSCGIGTQAIGLAAQGYSVKDYRAGTTESTSNALVHTRQSQVVLRTAWNRMR